MKRPVVLCMLLACLTGCGISKVVPDEFGRPALIAESGYSTRGCIDALKQKGQLLGVKIKNIRVENTGWDRTKTILLFPFAKGARCTADVE